MPAPAAMPPCHAHPSPNFNDRRGAPIDILLLHYTGMASDEDAIAWLCNPASEVSSHYFVCTDGRILQLVEDRHRAWHAGRSCWTGERELNSRSIGIEIANAGHRTIDPEGRPAPFADAQIDALVALCGALSERHDIRPERVLGHSDVSPGRKIDPGEMFPWGRLAAAGIGHWVPPAPLANGPVLREGDAGPAVKTFQALLALYGYDAPVSGEFCAKTANGTAAFQRHFRPERIDGAADASTWATLERLIAALP